MTNVEPTTPKRYRIFVKVENPAFTLRPIYVENQIALK